MTQSHGLPQPLLWSQLRDISIRTDEGAKRGTPQCWQVWHKPTIQSKARRNQLKVSAVTLYLND